MKKPYSILINRLPFSEDLAPNDLRQIDIYCHLAKIYLLQNRVGEAGRNLQLASELLKDNPTSLYAPNFHAIESMYFIKRKLWKDALQTIEKGLQVAEKLGARQEIRLLRYQKAKLFEGQRNWSAAKQVLLTMYQQGFVELNTDKKQLFEDLATIDSNLGNYRGAYEWMLKHRVLSEEVYAQQTKLQIAGLEAKYNYDQKEKELLVAQEKAERQRTIIWLVVSIAVIALIVVYFWYQSWRRRTIQQLRQQQQIELGKALLDGEERERSRLARDLHDGLGGMLAGIKLNLAQMIEQQASLGEADLKQTVDRLGYSVKELRRIARNLMPESLVRSGLEAALKDLCTEAALPMVTISFRAFDIQPYFSAQVQLMIYRIVQELIYNVLKHAGASRIIVQCSQSSGMFFITVEDNGKGFPTAAQTDTGQGLKNIHNRVDLLNGKIEVESSVEGTNIYIELYVE
ncbi:sensor histidine kinase [Sphingobacterium detergens]|uniref:sensor histidine kinase n=1 Tax=Sphingobacterium detergens TaxID=1145106 RepID=UPI000E76857C|nr:ATP-binding protein [Sphingobacterium detergens]